MAANPVSIPGIDDALALYKFDVPCDSEVPHEEAVGDFAVGPLVGNKRKQRDVDVTATALIQFKSQQVLRTELPTLNKPKQSRRKTTPEQLKVLESVFESDQTPDLALRTLLAEQLGMTPRRVQIWFQNKRAKIKRIAEEHLAEMACRPDPKLVSMVSVADSGMTFEIHGSDL